MQGLLDQANWVDDQRTVKGFGEIRYKIEKKSGEGRMKEEGVYNLGN